MVEVGGVVEEVSLRVDRKIPKVIEEERKAKKERQYAIAHVELGREDEARARAAQLVAQRLDRLGREAGREDRAAKGRGRVACGRRRVGGGWSSV